MIRRFEEFSGAIACIHRQIQKIERAEMARYGLKGPHVQCMLALARNPEGVTATRLCEICDKDKAAISRTVAELVAAGMVMRCGSGSKRYRVQLRLTEQGSRIAREVTSLTAKAVAQAGVGLSQEDRMIFYRVINQIASNIQQLSLDGIRNPED